MQIKTGPFLRTPLTIEQIMLDVLISLLPATIAGVVFFGFPALVVLGLSTLTAVVTEALLLRSPLTPRGIFGDGSAAVTGLLVGLILPPTTAWWIPVLGSFLAIALVKWAFGGIGYNIFNPALGARAILLLAFTSQMVKFTVPFDTITAATPLLTSRSFSWSLVWGNVGGSIGETSVIAILLGALYLLYKQHINWRIPVGYVGSAFVLALLWGLDPWFTITAGGLLFAAVFMATDMVTSPVTPTGQLIFGIGCGVLTLVIRQYTPFPEGVTFAVLTMNALAPAIESLTIPTCFGVGLSRETRYKGVAVGVASLLVVVGVFVALERFQPAVTPIISYGQHLPIAEFLGTDDYEVVEQGGIRYYLTYDEDENPQTVAFIGEQGGFNGPIRFLLVLDENQQITEVQILEHREDPGLGELITRSAFLDQFKGLDRDSAFALGTDIQAVSGATISSRSFTTGVRRALENFDATFYPQEEVGAWVDGTFAGKADSFGGPLEVEVTVSGGKISAVQVLKHSDTPGISDGAIKNVPERIVAANSFQVDAFSGATVTSDAIMKAVQKAVEQGGSTPSVAPSVPASKGGYTIPQDGVYRGSTQGFGGELVLEVTVSGGKISAIEVIETKETPFIADNAFKTMLPAIVEAQGPVDTVSGATVTSKAVLAAVEVALSGTTTEESVEEVKVETYEITVGDGTYRGSAQGFGGELVVEVTVSGGKITEIEVVENQETPFIASAAFKTLPQAIIEAQGPVDAVSGATVTSGAVQAAVRDALNIKEGR